jgi:hypothetical protein
MSQALIHVWFDWFGLFVRRPHDRVKDGPVAVEDVIGELGDGGCTIQQWDCKKGTSAAVTLQDD